KYEIIWAQWETIGNAWFSSTDKNYRKIEPNTTVPHVHKDVIIAWANGHQVEIKDYLHDSWINYNPSEFFNMYTEFRIKPKTLYQWLYLDKKGIYRTTEGYFSTKEKAEVFCKSNGFKLISCIKESEKIVENGSCD
ncbi:MAG TPA: hypothetical protein VFM18_09925, partial [Methanosarcina sp.]|nr:hypothetical protein [Methanosarcina sp.]